jgi:hypothetical protein
MNSWELVHLTFIKAQIFNINLKQTKRNAIWWFHLSLVNEVIHLITFFFQMILLTTNLCEDEDIGIFELVFRQIFPEIFHVLGFNIIFASVLLVLYTNLSFSRNFDMAIIITTSKLLTRKFEIFNEKLSLNLSVSI